MLAVACLVLSAAALGIGCSPVHALFSAVQALLACDG